VDPSLDIFRVAHCYLEGDLTLDDLQEWLVPRLGIFLVDPHCTASELAGLLEVCFADIAAGEADEDEVRDLIGDFLRTNEMIVLANVVRTTTSNARASIQPLFAGIPRSTFNPFEPLPAGR
jgi:hypothetical protein